MNYCCNNPEYETKKMSNGQHYRVCKNCQTTKFGAVDKALKNCLNIIFSSNTENNEQNLKIQR
jgi:hypothetical protein